MSRNVILTDGRKKFVDQPSRHLAWEALTTLNRHQTLSTVAISTTFVYSYIKLPVQSFLNNN